MECETLEIRQHGRASGPEIGWEFRGRKKERVLAAAGNEAMDSGVALPP